MASQNDQKASGASSAGAMWLAVAAGIVLAAGVAIVAFAGEAAVAALAVILVDGGVAALWVLSAAGAGAWLVRLTGVAVHPAMRFASSVAVGMGIYGLVILLLGLAGGFSGVAAWILFFGGLALGAIGLRGMLRAKAGFTAGEPVNAAAWIWVMAGLSWGTMLIAGALPPGLLWSPLDPHAYDVLSYHLQVPREWYELGRIAPLMHNVFSHFPMGVEVHFLAGMELMGGPWKGMYFAHFVTGAMAMVAAVGVYGVCRTLSLESRLLPAVAGVIVACTPWVMMLGSVAYTEAGLILYAALAVGWLLVGMSGSGRMGAFVAGGVLAGFACGTKYTGVPMVLLGVPLAATAAVLIERVRDRDAPIGRTIVGAAVFVIAGLVLFSPWLIRNAAWTGNPVFPLLMPELGQGHFTDEQVERWEVAHAPSEADWPVGARFGLLGERIAWDWQYGFVLPLAGVVLGLAAWRDRRAVALLLLVVLMVGVWMGFTHLQGRFLTVMIPILAMLIGLAPPLAWTRMVGIGAMGIVAVVGWVQVSGPLERVANVGRAGYFGMSDLGLFMPEGVDTAESAGRSVALVGDVRPFIYPIPMDRLTYRTVFDVLPSADWQAAWLPDGLADLIVISPEEWDRLANTYRHVPPVPAEFRQRGWILLEKPDQ